jgi:hypothetical protein
MSLGAVGASVGLGRLAAQRVRADRSFLLALWLVVLAATTLVAAGFQYSQAVGVAGLQRALLNAAPADRGISVQTTATAAQAKAFDGIVSGIVGKALGPVAPVSLAARSTSLAPLGMASDLAEQHLTVLGGYADLEEHARLTAGSWPIAGRDPLEATLSAAAAAAMGLSIGDHLGLVDASVPGAPDTPLLTVVITGTWTANPEDPYWLGDPFDLAGVLDQGSIAFQGPLMVAPADLLTRGLIPRLNLTWRAGLATKQVSPADLPRLVQAIPGLAPALATALPPHQSINVTVGLAPVLAGVQQSLVLAQGGVTLLTLQFVVLAAFAVILVAALLGERRRRENRILESRGATRFQIVTVTTGEAVLVSVPAVILAPVLAAVAIHLLAAGGPLAGAGIDLPLSVSAVAISGAVLAGLFAAATLVAPTVSIGGRFANLRLALGREDSHVSAQRFGIDLALLLVAGLAIWQLRLYGSPVTGSGGALGVDPLLVAGPAIGLAACSLLATRALPRLARLAERLLARRPNLVPQLGAHDLARRPLRSIRSTLLVMLAAGLTTFAVVYDATWFSSQADQAAYQAATDVRVVTPAYSNVPGAFLGPSYRALSGVTSASPTIRTTVDVGGALRSADLMGIDALGLSGGPLGPATTGLAGARPVVPALDLPGHPQRLQVTVDAALASLALPGFGLPTGEDVPAPQGISVSAVVIDGDGGITRFTSSNQVAFRGFGQALEIPLQAASSGGSLPGVVNQLAAPLRLEALEIVLTPTIAITNTTGTLDVRAIQASDAAGGADWTPVAFDPGQPGWSWLRTDPVAQTTYLPPTGRPSRIVIDSTNPIQSFFQDGAATFRASAAPAGDVVVGAIASSSFLAATGDRVGDKIDGSVIGNPVQFQIVGESAGIPPLDPARPSLVVDGPTLSLADYFGRGGIIATSEWWLSVRPGSTVAVDRALAGAPFSATTIISRDALLATLQGDPVGLGVVGALLLGAISAVVFAALGFLVSAAASIESRADEFGLLRALGLTDGQLLRWLAAEQGLLLVIGVAGGIALGIAFGWVVLPAVNFTGTGARPVPEAALVVPGQVLLAMVAGSLGLLVATLIVARRIIGRISVAATLRAVVE